MTTSGTLTTITCDDFIRSHDAICVNIRKIIKNLHILHKGVIKNVENNALNNQLTSKSWFDTGVYLILFVLSVLI